jgi:PAS domain-containing protein
MDPVYSSQILNGLIETSRLGIIAQDAAGRVQMWNHGAERILGWSEKEVLRRPAPAALQLLKITEGENASLPRKDGTVVDVDVWTDSWSDASGNTRGMLAIIIEVSHHP